MKEKKVAVFAVDMQNGFSKLCPEELPVEFDVKKMVEKFYELRKLADVTVGSKDCHPSDAIHIASKKNPQFTPIKNGGKNVDIYWNSHCVVGTYGNKLLPDMPKIEEFDFMVYKGVEPNFHPYGACYHDLEGKTSTGVIEWLRAMGVKQILVSGIAVDYCVSTTAIQLAKAEFGVTVVLEACAGIAKETIDKAIEEMKKANIDVVDKIEDIKIN